MQQPQDTVLITTYILAKNQRGNFLQSEMP